ncbi:MAG TPA: hypothetical protein VMS22_06835 [Candidatus Eisenbacteria bacterium]|nr:hypothetical protein [Candidatus Eisenbacteria bacterium]
MARFPTPIRFAHAVFRTPRLAEMTRWYGTVLGAHKAGVPVEELVQQGSC